MTPQFVRGRRVVSAHCFTGHMLFLSNSSSVLHTMWNPSNQRLVLVMLKIDTLLSWLFASHKIFLDPAPRFIYRLALLTTTITTLSMWRFPTPFPITSLLFFPCLHTHSSTDPHSGLSTTSWVLNQPADFQKCTSRFHTRRTPHICILRSQH